MGCIWRIPPVIMALLSPPFSRPLLCGKQATQTGETWVTSVRGGREGKGGWAAPAAVPIQVLKRAPFFFFWFSFFALASLHPPPFAQSWPAGGSALQPGVVHGGSEWFQAVRMNFMLLHNCFVYSQPCDCDFFFTPFSLHPGCLGLESAAVMPGTLSCWMCLFFFPVHLLFSMRVERCCAY